MSGLARCLPRLFELVAKETQRCERAIGRHCSRSQWTAGAISRSGRCRWGLGWILLRGNARQGMVEVA